MVKDITIFQHIYKNGGSSIREGFNAAVIMERYPEKKLKIFYTNGKGLDEECIYEFNPTTLIRDNAPIFFTGRGNIWKIKDALQNQECTFNVRYIITLRDPIDRLLSAYNFYHVQCKQMLNISELIPFKIWYHNRFVLTPVAHVDQLSNVLACFSEFEFKEEFIKFNSIFYSNVRQQIVANENKKIFQRKMQQIDVAIELLQKYCDLVTFIENHIESIKSYLNLPFNDSYKWINSSKEGHVQFTRDDLLKEDFKLIEQELEPEIIFYEKCKELFS